MQRAEEVPIGIQVEELSTTLRNLDVEIEVLGGESGVDKPNQAQQKLTELRAQRDDIVHRLDELMKPFQRGSA